MTRTVRALFALAILFPLIISSQPAFAARKQAFSDLKAALSRSDTATVLIVGDSTSSYAGVFIERLMNYIAAISADHRLILHRFDRSKNAFSEPTETGIGAKALEVFNASANGFRFKDWTGDRFRLFDDIKPTVVILNLGLNSAFLKDAREARAEFVDGLKKIRSKWAKVPIIMHLQQPMSDNRQMRMIVSAQRAAARQFRNVYLVDTYSTVMAMKKPRAWYYKGDNTHFNALGDAIVYSIWVREWDRS